MSEAPPLSPLQALADKRVLLLGTTGFLAKIVLAMILERFSVRRLFVLIRPTRSQSAEERLWGEVLKSEMMAPLRERFGDAFDAMVREMVVAVAGDVSKPRLGLDDATHARLKREVDLVINSAGLVSFNPPLDSAVDANARGALEVAKFCLELDRPRLVHVSTCFVAGDRSGRIREDTPILGYFPKQAEFDGVRFDWQRELEDLDRIVRQVKDRTADGALEATFRKDALDRLRRENRDPNPRTLRAAITNQRRRWVQEEQIRLGLERSRHWGWPNIYTLTKALGEQAIASQDGLDWAIVRPAIVESALKYPFPGWNEGMNTSAPLAYLGMNGQVVFPGRNDLILDVVPVDAVSSAILAAAAALIEGERCKVYQVAAGDVNPVSMARTVTLVGLYKRRAAERDRRDGKLPEWKAALRKRIEPLPVKRKTYERLGPPTLKKAVSRLKHTLAEADPERYGPFGDLVARARKAAERADEELDRLIDVFDLFMPFIWENSYVFRTNQTRALFARMNAADRALLPYDIETIDWRHYWLEVHLPGLERWVFPRLDPQGPRRLQIPRDYRDLAELFSSRTKEHARRVAYRVVKKGNVVADSYTYRDVRRAASVVRRFLEERGVRAQDRVLLVSEGRPEWGICYFGTILAGATVVPVDPDLSYDEIRTIATTSCAKAMIASGPQAARFTPKEDASPANGESFEVPVWSFSEIFARAHERGEVDDAEADKPARRRTEDIASIIFTSGTTGKPKGVVLTDRNFTALTARMMALFDLSRTDSLLSVLPPHHTFEFSAGLLMPFAAGASVTYLEDRTPELISRAFDETPVTAVIGVPAVWESLHRKLLKEIEARGRTTELVIRALMRFNRLLRERFRWNLGRWIFRPVHDALGGRMRYMVSGAAALDQNILKNFRAFGFSMYEGYGLTEASPVLSVGWPRMKNRPGSVGWPLPGVDIRIHEPDGSGIGEITARGPTIMRGYWDAPDETNRALRDGWLFTGDRGRLDDEGRLYIVGREKDVIIDSGGKNVYPDEIERLYSGSPLVREFSVVGVPATSGTGERVAALVVPDYGAPPAQGLDPEEVQRRIREHFKEVGSKLPLARRVKLLHVWDGELPRTSTRKVKRDFVRKEIERQERSATRVRAENGGPRALDRTTLRVQKAIAAICQTPTPRVTAASRLVDALGFDSIMRLELFNTLEAEFPHAELQADEFEAADTVADVVKLVARNQRAERAPRKEEVGSREEARPFHVPGPVASVAKSVLGWAQRTSYTQLLECEVEGRGNIPANRNFIVAANHASHLDMGLVKHALEPFGRNLRTLAARDYFFDDSYRRIYFENFTNLLPIDRHGSLKKSLRLACEAIHGGQSLLIFPEGTRSREGIMASFKPAIGYLSLSEAVDILPMYLGGTHHALPVGAFLPKQRDLWVRIGAPIDANRMREETRGMARSAAYRHVARRAEDAVRALGRLPIEPRAPADRDPAGRAARDEEDVKPSEP